MGFLSKLFPSHNDKELKKLEKKANEIEALADKYAAMSDEGVLAAVKEAEEFLAGQGRVLVRASGTEPLVRTLAEAPTDELCRKANAFVLEALKPFQA